MKKMIRPEGGVNGTRPTFRLIQSCYEFESKEFLARVGSTNSAPHSKNQIVELKSWEFRHKRVCLYFFLWERGGGGFDMGEPIIKRLKINKHKQTY